MPAATVSGFDPRSASATNDPERNAETVRRITDLFLRDCERLRDEHVAVFDEVISMLAARIEAHARAELAERLADLDNAPPGLMRRLARDEILVARPILSRSPRLSDQDLVDVALALGRNHMIAITERDSLSETVTDVLVEHGDQVVLHAAVRNPKARFSDGGYGRLVSRSRHDEALQAMLGERPDLPLHRLKELIEVAKASVRQRLLATLGDRESGAVDAAVEAGAATGLAEAVGALWQTLGPSVPAGDAARKAEAGTLCESDVYTYALSGNVPEAGAALNLLAQVPPPFAEKMLTDPPDDLLLIVCRSLDFSWETVDALRRLKKQPQGVAIHVGKLRNGYETLNRVTAQRVVRFLRARDPGNAISGAPGLGSVVGL
ncbi:DUF2336 domain-containing protein [Alsobacter sp. R-9]